MENEPLPEDSVSQTAVARTTGDAPVAVKLKRGWATAEARGFFKRDKEKKIFICQVPDMTGRICGNVEACKLGGNTQ